MMCPFFMHCVDTASNIGRRDYASMSQETLIELVIEGAENKGLITKAKRKMKDIIDWTGLRMNQSGKVTEIQWHYISIFGSVSLQWVPSTVVLIGLIYNKLTGSIPFESLPSSLVELTVMCSQFLFFRGTMD